MVYIMYINITTNKNIHRIELFVCNKYMNLILTTIYFIKTP